ncbi:MAG: SAM-dependent methyltransferase, partial [Defluviitaleaceae bacterium]|nr:SAM-dependent methyltransferase [Defluviitaleaceae bacterium]
FRIILSAAKTEKFSRIEIIRNEEKFQASMYTKKQVFHVNRDFTGMREFVAEHFGANFSNCNAWDGEFEYSLRVTKKGKILSSRKRARAQDAPPNSKECLDKKTDASKMHFPVSQNNFVGDTFNRQKNHIIREGDAIPILVDIGVFTKDFKVAAPMRDKFHQINRFLELLDDETKRISNFEDLSQQKKQRHEKNFGAENTDEKDFSGDAKTINIIDFGCGKSYLTFLVYYFFAQIRKLSVDICGLDLNDDIVKKCTAAAKKFDYKIKFLQGDIGSLSAPPLENWGAPNTFNIVISLHACDTATDHALFNAIKWRADLIFAAPCCQHELRAQMQPRSLGIFSKYGIIKERIASLATDAIRAELLEICGYKAQIIEFAALEHTAKNLLIRARKNVSKRENEKNSREIENILREFSFEPMLLKLLREQ